MKIPKNLDWAHLLVSCLHLATENLQGYSLVSFKPHQLILQMSLKEKFKTEDEKPLRVLCKSFAEANDTKLRGLSFKPTKLEMVIGLRHENGPSRKRNPLEEAIDQRRSQEKKTMV